MGISWVTRNLTGMSFGFVTWFVNWFGMLTVPVTPNGKGLVSVLASMKWLGRLTVPVSPNG